MLKNGMCVSTKILSLKSCSSVFPALLREPLLIIEHQNKQQISKIEWLFVVHIFTQLTKYFIETNAHVVWINNRYSVYHICCLCQPYHLKGAAQAFFGSE